jgi:hypothetical protein
MRKQTLLTFGVLFSVLLFIVFTIFRTGTGHVEVVEDNVHLVKINDKLTVENKSLKLENADLKGENLNLKQVKEQNEKTIQSAPPVPVVNDIIDDGVAFQFVIPEEVSDNQDQ